MINCLDYIKLKYVSDNENKISFNRDSTRIYKFLLKKEFLKEFQVLYVLDTEKKMLKIKFKFQDMRKRLNGLNYRELKEIYMILEKVNRQIKYYNKYVVILWLLNHIIKLLEIRQ